MSTTPPPPPGPGRASGSRPPRGLRASVKRVVGHLGSLARLQKELARVELQQKGAKLGAGVVLAVGAGVFAFFAVAFGLATAAAALALVLDWWLALLIVFGVLLLITTVLLLVAVRLLRKATPLAPQHAIEEARLTKQVLRGSRGA